MFIFDFVLIVDTTQWRCCGHHAFGVLVGATVIVADFLSVAAGDGDNGDNDDDDADDHDDYDDDDDDNDDDDYDDDHGHDDD